jgi:glyoxylase-like metal-dependent hydrolase (beta-lactamase superfamily II)
MPNFEQILPDIYLLKVPFGVLWTGVVLVKTDEDWVMIDSGPSAERVDDTIVPALAELKLSLYDVKYLLCTHTHGDHIGGHYRVKEINPEIIIGGIEASVPKLADPLKYNKLIRAVFPEFSPPPSAGLRGVEVELSLRDGDKIGGRLRLVATPGHDDDAVCWFDEPTKTIITGDSLQGDGTITQGLGLYMYYPEYKATIRRLESMLIENVIAGHDYKPMGYIAKGRTETINFFASAAKVTNAYNRFITAKVEADLYDLPTITKKLIEARKNEMPDFLFLALYTVKSHIENFYNENG